MARTRCNVDISRFGNEDDIMVRKDGLFQHSKFVVSKSPCIKVLYRWLKHCFEVVSALSEFGAASVSIGVAVSEFAAGLRRVERRSTRGLTYDEQRCAIAGSRVALFATAAS